VEEPEPEFDTGDEPDAPDAEDLEGRAEKFYVDDAAVFVTADSLYLVDARTGRLRLVDYRDYVGDRVRALYPDPRDLRAEWRAVDGRDRVRETLAVRGISFEELAERAGLPDADPFDLLVHLAWNTPVVTRRERAGRVRREHADFLDRFAADARQILDELLEKYAEFGVGELSDLRVLEVPPFPDRGTPTQIAALFGGAPNLREAVDELQELLYAA
jgi:type I restriction enzyme, R subunit